MILHFGEESQDRVSINRAHGRKQAASRQQTGDVPLTPTLQLRGSRSAQEPSARVLPNVTLQGRAMFAAVTLLVIALVQQIRSCCFHHWPL